MDKKAREKLRQASLLLFGGCDLGGLRATIARDIADVLEAEPDYHPGHIAIIDHASRAEHDQNVLHVRVPKGALVICENIEWRMVGSD